MKLLVVAAFAVALLAVVYIFARPYLIEHSAAWRAFCARVDPWFTSWLSKSRQIALARLAGLSGAVVAVASTVGDIPIDWQMVADLVVQRFPASWQPFVQKMLIPVGVWGYGEFMRRATTAPLAEKE